MSTNVGHLHRDGVVHRLTGGAILKTPPQPMNNAGEAIQAASLLYRRLLVGRVWDCVEIRNTDIGSLGAHQFGVSR
jgi:hypothetical protein